ncbi:MAG TPA: DUF4124 domain-containing protein [Steroidobacteraceae bacterium]|jgi:hypothetical protein|nr:DUF4124 domain-containing protein [Steroidobacteraceae bacterium]
MCSAAIALACASTFAATTVYKWVDEKGVVHYSDQPHPDAQKLDVQSAQTYSSGDARRVPSYSTPTSNPQPTGTYRVCAIARPENDEVFLNTDTVNAQVRLQPALRPGDRLTITMDGKTVQDGASTSATIKVERGSHSLAATVTDSSGALVCSTPSVTFHVRQPSRLAPNPANRPRF